MTNEHMTDIRLAVLRLLREHGMERDAELMEREIGVSTVAHLMIVAAIEATTIVTQ